MLQIAFAEPRLPTSGVLILLVAEGAAPSGLWQQADAALGGAVTRAAEAAAFTGKQGKNCTVLAPGGGLSRVILIGLGEDALTGRTAEDVGGSALAAILAGDGRETGAVLAADALSADLAAAVAFGAVLRAYRFNRYRTKEKEEDKPALVSLQVAVSGAAAAQACWPRYDALARGVFLGRDLVSEPPNILTPIEMARRCEALRDLGVEVETFGPDAMRELGFGALLAVAQGSVNEPRMVAMRWRGAASDAGPIALIGKGVTFDSGGISIKPAAGMEDMKWDMAGAGAVIGAMAVIAGRKARADVLGVVGLVENMPSGNAQRPGDVVTTASGQTVEIINTDAEGRLVLADVVWWTAQTHKPACMIDLATLTGAMIISLGHEHAGLFSSDDALAERLLEAGKASGETLWRMPLGDAYDKGLKSDIADMKNTGPRPGGAISAAHFIKRFTCDLPWAHLDIAGLAWSSEATPTVPKGATAYGVRLLDRLIADHHEV